MTTKILVMPQLFSDRVSSLLLDIDECSSETDDCSDLATCANIDGWYVCECVAGYTGDGVSCTGNRLQSS